MNLLRALVLLLWCAAAHSAVLAQEQAGAALDDAARARLLQFESELDTALVSANDPASLWVRGLLTRTDDEARARDLAAAHQRAPSEIVYLASLASECQVNRVPRPAACAQSDWLAKWASVDADNAAPWVMLAARSVRIRQPERAVADLVHAAGVSRFDEYAARSAARAWSVMRRTIPARGDDVSGVLLVGRWEPRAGTAALGLLCQGGPIAASPEGRDACVRLTSGAMARADSIEARRTAARVAEYLAGDVDAKARAHRTMDDLGARGRACARWLSAQAGTNEGTLPGAAVRVQAWLDDLERSDEEAACERHAR